MSLRLKLPTKTEMAPRRSERQRKPPDFYGIRVNVSSEKPCEPATIEEATNCSEKTEWMQAMENKMKSLKQNNVWELVELPSGRKTVGSKLVYKVKTGVDGSVECYWLPKGTHKSLGQTMTKCFVQSSEWNHSEP